MSKPIKKAQNSDDIEIQYIKVTDFFWKNNERCITAEDIAKIYNSNLLRDYRTSN